MKTLSLLALAAAAYCACAAELDLGAMIQPVSTNNIFREPGYNVWCGSMVAGKDGKYYLFYSRWPKELTHMAWVTHSEVARAVADSPFGPYKPAGVVLPARGKQFWDGLCTHNPTVIQANGKYYLYYMGTHGEGGVGNSTSWEFRPATNAGSGEMDPRDRKQPLNWSFRNNQRIGVAVADTPAGPWQRFDQPVLDVSSDSDAPDALMVSNPAVTQRPDGGFLMVYKAVAKKGPMPFGGPVVHLAAVSDRPTGPFKKQLKPIFTRAGLQFATEDPFIWHGGDRYWAVVKDNQGYFTGKGYSLALFQSPDGFDWSPARHLFVTTPKLRWADGKDRTLTALERPQLYFENGQPAALFCAAADNAERSGSFNLEIPLISRPAQGVAAEVKVYRQVDGRDLKLFIEKPADWKASDRRPAIVFFFGGGWVGGTPEQFRPQSEYLASRGMVGIRVEYRVIPRGDSGPPVVCCTDAKAAMRYVRAHANELGVDPDRIAAAGGSAGGHLAAFTALVPGFEEPAEGKPVSAVPNALVLFNPVLDNGPGEWGHQRVGNRFREFSPAHNVQKGAPPAIVFLGDSDKLIPVPVMQRFADNMKKVGTRCDLHIYPGAGHGFFNKGDHQTLTLLETDKFLASLGWLKGPPTITPPAEANLGK